MEQRSLRVNGVEISYTTAGSGEPLLYVHGNTGSNVWYERVMEIDGRRTVAPDLPNFGDSGRIESADIDLYADYVRDFLIGLQLETPLPVVGHSLGGAVAMSLTLRHPEMVSRLLLVDSAPPEGLKTPEEHYPIIERYKSETELMRKALQAVTPTLDDAAFLDRLVAEAQKMNPSAFAGNARALERFDYRGTTGEFDRPVKVVVGEKDIIISQEMAAATARAFPNAELEVLEGVGHSVMVEAPDRFVSVLKAFL